MEGLEQAVIAAKTTGDQARQLKLITTTIFQSTLIGRTSAKLLSERLPEEVLQQLDDMGVQSIVNDRYTLIDWSNMHS